MMDKEELSTASQSEKGNEITSSDAFVVSPSSGSSNNNDVGQLVPNASASVCASASASASVCSSASASNDDKQQSDDTNANDNHAQSPSSKSTSSSAFSGKDDPTKDDATIAQIFAAQEQLTTLFQFPPDLALRAIEAIGPHDITALYNWILDGGHAGDKGGPIVPKADCPHVKYHLKVKPSDVSSIGIKCSYFEDVTSSSSGGAKSEVDSETGLCPDGENWICLECGVTRCSRYVNGHCKSHWESTKAMCQVAANGDDDGAGHCIAVSSADLSVWCYECNAYLVHPKLNLVIKRLEELKFGDDEENNDGEDVTDVDIDKESTNEEKENKDCSNCDEEKFSEDDSNEIEEGGDSRGGKESDDNYSEEHESIDEEKHRDVSLFGEEALPHPHLPKSLSDLANYILSDDCKSIVILSGAGMSRASGRGMYDTLNPDLLTANEIEREAMKADPTTVFEKNLFIENSLPCLELKRPFILGTWRQEWKATIAHRFVELLHSKTGKLTRLYTQNIDGLEGQCTLLPRDKVIPVHGSMDRAACELCGMEMDFEEFCEQVKCKIKDISGRDTSAPKYSTPISCSLCGNSTVKPSIVLFRSPLPEEFFRNIVKDMPHTDLLIVVGTSLCVSPANSLVYQVPPTTLRVVVNNEPVGYRLGIQYGPDSKRDYFAKGMCDEILLELMDHLGWVGDLKDIINDLPEGSPNLVRKRLKTS